MANWSKSVIGEFKFGKCMFHAQVLRMQLSIIDTHDIIKKSVRYSKCVSQLDSTASEMEMFQIESCVRGHHIYKDIWNPSSGEELTCSREIESTKDLLAVAIKRGTAHVPRKISKSARDYIKIAS